MRALTMHFRVGCFFLIAGLFLAACQEEAEAPFDTLIPVLDRERAQALAAERIGPDGGTLRVSKGDLSGFTLEIPPGALHKDAVFSVYPAKAPREADGYRALGAFAMVTATVDALLADAVLTVPYEDDSDADVTRVVLLARNKGLHPVAGASRREMAMRGLVRTFGDFGVAYDLSEGPDGGGPGFSARCPRMDDGITMRTAIGTTSIIATNELANDAKVLTLRSYGSNGCGYSRGWEVHWYSVTAEKVYQYASWATAAGIFLDSSSLPACTPSAVNPAVDSPKLTDDLAKRWGATPQELEVEALNCHSEPSRSSPRIRLKVKGAGDWFEYGMNGTFLERN